MVLIEIWRPVLGFSGLYEVSNLGRVRSIRGRHGEGRVLNPKLPENPREYMAVSLHDGAGRRLRRTVHTLVAGAFLPERPSPTHEVRHFNGDRGNNAASNLRWGSKKDNADDRQRHGRTAAGPRHGCWIDGRKTITRHMSAARAKAFTDSLRARASMKEKEDGSLPEMQR